MGVEQPTSWPVIAPLILLLAISICLFNDYLKNEVKKENDRRVREVAEISKTVLNDPELFRATQKIIREDGYGPIYSMRVAVYNRQLEDKAKNLEDTLRVFLAEEEVMEERGTQE